MASKYNAKFMRITSPHDGVLLVEMSRPPANAFNRETWSELRQIFGQINFDGDVRAVVLASANPKIFNAGLDLKDSVNFKGPEFEDTARTSLANKQYLLDFQAAISSIERCKFPVIAAIHGYALGLAVEIATACDIRYAASDVKFAIKEVDLGFAAGIGTLARLPKVVVNQSAARELAMTARTFGAQEAHEIGLVNRVVKGSREEVIKAALETAALIASKSPIAVVGTKHLMLHARDHTVQDNLEYTSTWNSAMLQSSDTSRAMQSALTKKPVQFSRLVKLSGKL